MTPGDLRNHLTPLGLACPSTASRRGMLQAPSVEEFQLAGVKEKSLSCHDSYLHIPGTEIHSDPPDLP